ncbi:MAG TPA: hypothetical protein VK864_04625, partial [Longimicrobiales bacterium]|nr:hypothetical protein [Longimicrobiales bacterium]
MTAGLPGSGIGGLFYLIGAVAMPFRELARRLGGRPRRGALVASQAALALSIIVALWATGWVLDWLIYGAAAGSGKRATSLANAYARIPHVFRMTSLLVSLGTLA